MLVNMCIYLFYNALIALFHSPDLLLFEKAKLVNLFHVDNFLTLKMQKKILTR